MYIYHKQLKHKNMKITQLRQLIREEIQSVIDEEDEIEVAFQSSPKILPWNIIEKTYTESGLSGEEFFSDVEDEFRLKFENKPVSKDEYYNFFIEQPNVGGQDDLYIMVNWINFTNPELADELYNMI